MTGWNRVDRSFNQWVAGLIALFYFVCLQCGASTGKRTDDMTEVPKFFVPEVTDPNKYEEVFEALAELSGFNPPPADRRIYSIKFVMTVRSGLPQWENVCGEFACRTDESYVDTTYGALFVKVNMRVKTFNRQVQSGDSVRDAFPPALERLL